MLISIIQIEAVNYPLKRKITTKTQIVFVEHFLLRYSSLANGASRAIAFIVKIERGKSEHRRAASRITTGRLI